MESTRVRSVNYENCTFTPLTVRKTYVSQQDIKANTKLHTYNFIFAFIYYTYYSYIEKLYTRKHENAM